MECKTPGVRRMRKEAVRRVSLAAELGKAWFAAMAAAMRTAERIRTTLLASGAGRRFAVVALMAAMSGAACGSRQRARSRSIERRGNSVNCGIRFGATRARRLPRNNRLPALRLKPRLPPQARLRPQRQPRRRSLANRPGRPPRRVFFRDRRACVGASRPCAESSRRDAAAGNSRGAAEGRNRDRLCRSHRHRGLDQYRQIDRARRRLS